MKATRRTPYLSGWCATNSHERCAGAYAGVQCRCSLCGDHVAAPPVTPAADIELGQTASYRLLEARLGRPLSAHVAECRTAGIGWRQLALDLRDSTKVAISHESL